MKAFFQGWVVAILVMAGAIAGNIQAVISQDVKTGNFLLAQTPVNADELEVAVALPQLAVVIFKGGESSSGQITGIDAQGEILSIQRYDKTATIPLSKIQRVVFKNGALVYRSNRQPIIRGERDRPTGKPVTWSGIPISTFTVKNSTQGQAVVKLKPPVVSPAQLRGIQSVARNRQYVVDEIQFNSQQRTITILAKPY
ncbi:hypothetical protein HUN01_20140 [Nostoc edaphicum CCNP1411]|uniref:Uncharacterized protein n=1 Tax=Nostoc edaphicum CCNP1411 TaxID=1472755 RepID=A0A7D7QE70_9NOSO|nr:hypothetical protein [Nostoc edaphicum]QMS89779.1 hypothetical protein HUN01_20140 [Nostoc edaphicum CCNP1411]